MTTSIKDFAANFQTLNTKQLSKIVGGNGYVTAAAPTKRRPFR
jgi:bacteriocin-like protein